MPRIFVALDFETANRDAASVCAMGLVRVEDEQVVAKASCLVRPRGGGFVFSYIHGITADDVKDAPAFGEAWASVAALFEGAEAIGAHNASFDRRVLAHASASAGMAAPTLPFFCTVALSKKAFGLRRASLDLVSAHLGIALNHHEALSDAEACARIAVAARGRGCWPPALMPSAVERYPELWGAGSPAR